MNCCRLIRTVAMIINPKFAGAKASEYEEVDAGANSACEFYVLRQFRLGATHCQRPPKREHGEE